MESLAGQILLSTPHITDPRFREQVIYLCMHNQEGAMGLALNRLHPHMTLHDVFLGANLALPTGKPAPVYLGGPVEQYAGFLLFQAEARPEHAIELRPGMYISRDIRTLESMTQGKGPQNFLFLLGYAGWAPGQLERELLENSWLVVPADDEIIFHTAPEKRWKKAASLLGIDITQLGEVTGNA